MSGAAQSIARVKLLRIKRSFDLLEIASIASHVAVTHANIWCELIVWRFRTIANGAFATSINELAIVPAADICIGMIERALQLVGRARHVRLRAQRLASVRDFRPPAKIAVALTSRVASTVSIARVRLEREAVAIRVDIA